MVAMKVHRREPDLDCGPGSALENAVTNSYDRAIGHKNRGLNFCHENAVVDREDRAISHINGWGATTACSLYMTSFNNT